MARISDEIRERRKERIWLEVRQHDGIRQKEISTLTGIENRTVNNYLFELDLENKVYKEGVLWFNNPDYQGTRLRQFTLVPEEAYTLYLAARLFVKQSDKRNEYAESALYRLAEELKSDIPVDRNIREAAQKLAQRQDQPGYHDTFQTLVRAYLNRHKVRLTYKPLWRDSFETTFEIYLIEPSAIGFSTYLIGYSSLVGELRSYKLSRIESAEVLRNETYAIPEDFPGLSIFDTAWSIITGEETIRVVLRFSDSVAQRVLETNWHPSQDYAWDQEKEGYLRWWVDVADTTDIFPWIRSWGHDVEILAPERLRKEMVRGVRQLAALYGVMTMGKQFVAHVRDKDKKIQSLEAHLAAVSNYAGQFAAKVGLKEVGEILGLLHDVGKASHEFQTYIRSGTGLITEDSPDWVDVKAQKGKIDHSTAGAQIIYQKLSERGDKATATALAMALCIASHHSGLIDSLKPDGENNFQRRIEKPEEGAHANEAWSNLAEIAGKLDELLSSDIEARFIEKLESLKVMPESPNTINFKRGLLVRYLLSCLIDADRLDTADFEFPSNERIRNYGNYTPWETLIERLNRKISEFKDKPIRNDVDDLRSQVSQACLDFAAKRKGIYQLTVPTGGGKTLASLRFALNHAEHHKLDRIVYIIPYTSIIDQNAEEVRKILEEKDKKGRYLNKVVLEHHSNLIPDDDDEEKNWMAAKRRNLLSDNWDAPIVFTTQVQFLEALFGSGTRSVRRMHQLANSVIIFDEVQTIPVRTVHMFNAALEFLVHGCGSTVVLCTATQPLLNKVEPSHHALNIDGKIIENEQELFEQLKRVEVFDKRKVGPGWTDKDVAELVEQELKAKGSVLVVVNTKNSASSLYQTLADNNPKKIVYHLSTRMCPAHRLNKLNEIKAKLTSKEPVIGVSTQLIEAGVDIDFGSVIRYLAGLDSITQAAGRCNRGGKQEDENGKKVLGNVFIVNPADESISRLPDIKKGVKVAERILSEFDRNPQEFDDDRLGLEAMKQYYEYYFYQRKEEMAYTIGPDSSIEQEDNLFNLLSRNSTAAKRDTSDMGATPSFVFKQSFQTASKIFQPIDSLTRGVIVPYGEEGKEIINELCSTAELEKQYKLIKKAQRYAVNLFPHEFKKLADLDAIREVQVGAGIYYLDAQYYSDEFGWSDDIVNQMDALFY